MIADERVSCRMRIRERRRIESVLLVLVLSLLSLSLLAQNHNKQGKCEKQNKI